MQPNPYMYNAYPTGAQPVRYAVPQGYRQPSPPYANQSFDRYAGVQPATRPPQGMTQPVRYPPGYAQGYYPPPVPMQAAPTSPRAQRPQQQPPPEQLQPPQPYYYNPYGANGASPTSPGPKAPPKKGGKEFKDNAFTIAPDGAHNESIKGLVSNNDINNLLKHKGTKVKISKIYRITKTKPAALNNDSSDEEIPPPVQQPTPAPAPVPFQTPAPALAPAPAPVERPVSSSSSDSHCSTCSDCSCSDCRHHRRSHTYDDCPECVAERERERARRRRRRH